MVSPWQVPLALAGAQREGWRKEKGRKSKELPWLFQGPRPHALPALTTLAEGARLGHKTTSPMTGMGSLRPGQP